MARNRVIYQSQAVEINGNTVAGVQSVSYGLDLAREDINQFGQLGALDRVILEAPTSNMEVNYYASGLTQAQLGGTAGLLSGAVTGHTFPLKVGLKSTEEDYAKGGTEIVITSGYLTSFSTEGSVGAIPTQTLTFEGLDLSYGTNSQIALPDTGVTFPLQQNVTVQLGTDTTSSLGDGDSEFDVFVTHAQSATFSFELGVEPLNQLGNAMAYARVPSYPATATMAIEGLAVSGKLALALTDINSIEQRARTATSDGWKEYDCEISIGGIKYQLVNASVDSVSFDSSIGDNATCSLTLASSIGGEHSHSTMRVA